MAFLGDPIRELMKAVQPLSNLPNEAALILPLIYFLKHPYDVPSEQETLIDDPGSPEHCHQGSEYKKVVSKSQGFCFHRRVLGDPCVEDEPRETH